MWKESLVTRKLVAESQLLKTSTGKYRAVRLSPFFGLQYVLFNGSFAYL